MDEYKHTSSRNERLMMGLKAIEAEYYSIEEKKKLEQYNGTILYFAPLQFL